MATKALLFSSLSRSGSGFAAQGAAALGGGGEGRVGLVDGSRIAALDGHTAQVGNHPTVEMDGGELGWDGMGWDGKG